MTRKFKKWWTRMLSMESSARSHQLERWLYFAGKTCAFRGDQNQQRVVYTIHNRYKNSRYKRLTKANAWLVWSIVNQKQGVYRRVKTQNSTPSTPTQVIVKRKTVGKDIQYTRSTSYDGSKRNI